jgi:hypothetical protein
MNIMLIAAISFLFLLAWLFYRARKGVRRGVSELRRPIQDLYDRGINQGVLIITHAKSNKFIQFRKYKSGGKSNGIIFGFPSVTWSKPYYPKVKDLCLKEGILFAERNDGGVEFLEIDFDSDIDAAYEFSEKVLSRVFSLGREEKYFVALEGATG